LPFLLQAKRNHGQTEKFFEMNTGIYNNNFTSAFNRLLAKAKVTCYQIHQFSYLDQSYLSRLKNGSKKNPSPETIMKIALAIAWFSKEITLYDIETLFNSVGRSMNVK